MHPFCSRCILVYTCDDSVATVRAGNLAMPPPLRGRVSQRFHEDSAVLQLLGLACHAAGDMADHGRQRQAGGQRNRAVSPCTPLARSPSVDHEADILPLSSVHKKTESASSTKYRLSPVLQFHIKFPHQAVKAVVWLRFGVD